MTTVFAIITEAGTESKKFPLSSKNICQDGNCSLFQQFFLNLTEFVDDKNIVSYAKNKNSAPVKNDLETIRLKFGRRNKYKTVFSELSENGLAALALTSKYISDNLSFTNNDAVILSVPGKFVMSDRKKFADYAKKAVKLAKEGYIVSFSYSSEKNEQNGFYLKTSKSSKVFEIEPEALKVSSVMTKNDIKGKNVNIIPSGIYMYTPSIFFSELKKNEAELNKAISKIKFINNNTIIKSEALDKFNDKTFENSILSNSKKLVTLTVDDTFSESNSLFNKADINVDAALYDLYSVDNITNISDFKNKILAVSGDEVILTEMKTIKNTFEEELKKQRNNKTKVNRPWGYYTVLSEGNGYITKSILIKPGQKLSLQYHQYRQERWLVIKGNATAVKDKKIFSLKPGDCLDIDFKEIHSLQNLTSENVIVFEIQLGSILDENDIVRLEDIYGRV